MVRLWDTAVEHQLAAGLRFPISASTLPFAVSPRGVHLILTTSSDHSAKKVEVLPHARRPNLEDRL